MAVKMNSTDERFRDQRDIPLLMEIGEWWNELPLPAELPEQYISRIAEMRRRYEAIRDRRAREDAGEALP
jgi:hypothetical protein